ncbi:MAG: peptide deformylase [Bacteroides sp.]|nr:peptide deformylase [Eubacterium sp.]MCM1417950.1 peptide deformylase [Roseburia sp.]MCM1461803.1 peptide deformylase [Bacteroides sp.]
MALRNIVKFGEDILHKKCREVTAFDDKLWVLLDDMYETLKSAEGVGLAAPQVGILRRAIVIDVGDGVIELVNPVITAMRGKQREVEGCLSAPGQWGYVVRPAKVKVTAQNRYGKEIRIEGTELLARALCHEIDHLNGVIFTDLADEMVEPEDK